MTLAPGLVSPHFRPAAADLLSGPPRVSPGTALVRVDDADVGPILTDAADDVVGYWIRTAKSWEPGEGRFLRAILRPGMHVLDVGAHIGYFTRLMAQIVGDSGRVLAIESDPLTFQILRANIALADLETVELLPVAAGRKAGLVHGSREAGNQGGSTAFLATYGAASFPIQAVRLDDVLNPEVRIDFVKVDVEGMDLAVVQGLPCTIARWRPTLLVELNPRKSEAFGDRPEDVLREYRDLGLRIRLLGGDVLRLQREAGMELDELLHENLIVTPALDAELIECARQIDFVNLVLTPAP